jgi:acetyltransferase
MESINQLAEPTTELHLHDRTLITKRGRNVLARPIAHEDTVLLADLFYRISERTRRLRFSRSEATEELVWGEATRLTHADPQADAMMVGVVQEAGEDRAVAVVQMARVSDTVAEVGILVRDDYQNEGLGKAICSLTAQAAMLRGVRTLQIFTLAENRMVQWLVRSLGLPYTVDQWRGELTMMIQLPSY